MAFKISIHHSEPHATIVLKDTDTGCEAEIFTFGALLNAFYIPLHGHKHNVIKGYENVFSRFGWMSIDEIKNSEDEQYFRQHICQGS